MTTDVVLRFPWGRYHATPWGRHVNEAAVDWPPSPWRLLRALYSTWQFRAHDLDAAVVESLLEKLAEPPSYEVPPFTTAATRHYLPGKDHREGVAAERDLAIDAFVVIERDAELRMRWNVELSPAEGNALRRLLGQLTYLGRAESLCDAFLADPDEQSAPLAIQPLAHESGDAAVDVLAPTTPLDLGALTASTARVRTGDRRRLPIGARAIRYVRPEVVVPTERRRAPSAGRVEAIRWSLAGRALPSRHAAVALATRLRQAAMRAAGTDDRPIPSVMHGKSDVGSDGSPLNGHRHAHWIAFGEPDERLLTTVVAWAPDGFDAELLGRLAGLNKVRPGGVPDFGPQRLGLEGWGSISDVAPELAGASRVWRSYTPFAPSVHRKKGKEDDEVYLLAAVRRELEWRDLPAAVSLVVDRGLWRAYRSHRPDKERLRHSRQSFGLQLSFDEEVTGPLVLGALSHFGLGLFLPER